MSAVPPGGPYGWDGPYGWGTEAQRDLPDGASACLLGLVLAGAVLSTVLVIWMERRGRYGPPPDYVRRAFKDGVADGSG